MSAAPVLELCETDETTSRLLPSGVAIRDVADACRRAVVTFMDVAQAGGEPAYLAPWLITEYREAIELSGVLECVAPRGTAERRRVHPGQLASIVHAAAQRAMLVLAAFHATAANGAEPVVPEHLFEDGLVEPIMDDNGDTGYCPRTRPGMRLEERVLALLVAELLTRPNDVLEALAVDGHSVSLGASCPVRSPQSGCIRRGRQTMPWMPEDADGGGARAAWPIHLGAPSLRAPSLRELAGQWQT